jgi:hypothetical protein
MGFFRWVLWDLPVVQVYDLFRRKPLQRLNCFGGLIRCVTPTLRLGQSLGVVPPAETQLLELLSTDSCRFVLTRDPDALLTTIDRGLAIGHEMLAGFGLGRPDLDTALLSSIKEIQTERKNKSMGQAVLVVEAQGDIEASLKEPCTEFNEFIVTFGAIDNRQGVLGTRGYRTPLLPAA